MKFFVTGGTGRLGKVLVKRLLAKGNEVYVLNYEGLDLPAGCVNVQGGLRDIQALRKGIDGAAAIFHLAGLNPIEGTSATWEKLEKINIQGTKNIVNIMLELETKARLIFISSTSIYGKDPFTMPVRFDTPPRPDSDYARSKRDAEKILIYHKDRLNFVILRPSVIYGPTYSDIYRKFIKYIDNGKLPIFGEGKNVIPFIYADDLVDAMFLAAKKKEARGKAYIVTENKTRTQEDVYRLVAEALSKEKPKFNHMNPAIAKAFIGLMAKLNKGGIGPSHIEFLSSHRIFDYSKTTEELGWSPKTSLETGINQMVQAYLSEERVSKITPVSDPLSPEIKE